MDYKSKLRPFSLVVAMSRNRGIGWKGGFPWPLIKKDLAHFTRVTKCTRLAMSAREIAAKNVFYQSEELFSAESDPKLINPVIMGRKTWESVPLNMRPLPGRLNVILSTNTDYKPVFKEGQKDTPAPLLFPNLESALLHLSDMANIGEIYVVGGQGVFQQCLTEYQDLCKFVIVTRINKDYEADVFMPEVP